MNSKTNKKTQKTGLDFFPPAAPVPNSCPNIGSLSGQEDGGYAGKTGLGNCEQNMGLASVPLCSGRESEDSCQRTLKQI